MEGTNAAWRNKRIIEVHSRVNMSLMLIKMHIIIQKKVLSIFILDGRSFQSYEISMNYVNNLIKKLLKITHIFRRHSAPI